MGVPADSADCIYVRSSKKDKFSRKFRENVVSENLYEHFDFYYPCWSVGRLIEIYCLCTGVEGMKICLSEISLVELMVKLIEILVNAKSLNFSKLKD